MNSRDRVLVVGAGPIGLGIVLFARLAGADVAVFDRDRERAAAAKTVAPAVTVVNPAEDCQAAEALGSDELFDVVFDATGNPNAMERGFDFVDHGGRYVLVGVVKEPITFLDPDFHRKEMTLFGSRNATSVDFEHVIGAIRNGDVPADRLITHRTSLADAVDKIPLWATEKSGLVKAIIEID